MMEPLEISQEQPEWFVVVVSGVSNYTWFVNVKGGIYSTFEEANNAAALISNSKEYRAAKRRYGLQIHVRSGPVH